MGNTASTSQATTPRPGRSLPASPIVKTVSLPDDPNPSARAKFSRRKKSIELSDVDTSLSFTSSPAVAAARVGSRRKNERAVGDLSGEEDEADLAVGTLRGAMQGKAEHVVYGPRRDDGIAPSVGGAGKTPAIALRPTTIALPAHSLTVPAPLLDPDDTLHPSYKASPRLTSDVLLSSDRMPVIVSPAGEDGPPGSPFVTTGAGAGAVSQPMLPVSLSSAVAGIVASSGVDAGSVPEILLPPHTSSPFPPALLPQDTILAPRIPVHSLPLAEGAIPSGTSVISSPLPTPLGSDPRLSGSVLLPPNLFNSTIASTPIPLHSVPSATIAASLLAAAVDLGAGAEGVPTLIKWKNEDGQTEAKEGRAAEGPKQVFVTGTFAKGWKTKIELRKSDASDFSALISLPPGPHRLKFIVDKEWKASKHLPVATDADGNLINYLQVTGRTPKTPTSLLDWTGNSTNPYTPTRWGALDEEEDAGAAEMEDEIWTQEIPPELVEWGEWEAEREAAEGSGFSSLSPHPIPPPPPSSGVPPPSLPAQLEKGPLNHAAYVTQGSGDDNSILPKPDHSVINHLAASPIKGGFLSVGVTTRYKQKFVTIVYYKALAPRD